MGYLKWKVVAGLFLCSLCSVDTSAQFVKNERLISFEESQIPAYLEGKASQLGISDEHYKDGKQSLSWTFEPGAILTMKRDLKFEYKDPPERICTFLLLLFGCIMKMHRISR